MKDLEFGESGFGVQSVRLSGFGRFWSLGLSEEDFRFQSRDWNKHRRKNSAAQVRPGPPSDAHRDLMARQGAPSTSTV